MWFWYHIICFFLISLMNFFNSENPFDILFFFTFGNEICVFHFWSFILIDEISYVNVVPILSQIFIFFLFLHILLEKQTKKVALWRIRLCQISITGHFLIFFLLVDQFPVAQIIFAIYSIKPVEIISIRRPLWIHISRHRHNILIFLIKIINLLIISTFIIFSI